MVKVSCSETDIYGKRIQVQNFTKENENIFQDQETRSRVIEQQTQENNTMIFPFKVVENEKKDIR